MPTTNNSNDDLVNDNTVSTPVAPVKAPTIKPSVPVVNNDNSAAEEEERCRLRVLGY